jgi:hypothetical protein
MKAKVIILLFLAINSNLLIAQNFEPKQHKVNYCGDSSLINSQSSQFTQSQIFKGWMWGSRYVLSKSLFCTQSDNWYADSFTGIVDSANMFVRSNTFQPLYCNHGGGDNILLARAMVFNPALEIPDPITDYYSIANQCNQNNHSSVFHWCKHQCFQKLVDARRLAHVEKNIPILSKPQIIFTKKEKKTMFLFL